MLYLYIYITISLLNFAPCESLYNYIFARADSSSTNINEWEVISNGISTSTSFDLQLSEFSNQPTSVPFATSPVPVTNTITALSTTATNELVTVDTLNEDQAEIVKARQNILNLIEYFSEDNDNIQPIQPLFNTFENAVQRITVHLQFYAANNPQTTIASNDKREVVTEFASGTLDQVAWCIGYMNDYHSTLAQVQLANQSVDFLNSLVDNANKLINQIGTGCQDSGVNDLITKANSIWASSFSQIKEPSSCIVAAIATNTTAVFLNTTIATGTALFTNHTTNNAPTSSVTSANGSQATSGQTISDSPKLTSLLGLYFNLVILGLFIFI